MGLRHRRSWSLVVVLALIGALAQATPSAVAAEGDVVGKLVARSVVGARPAIPARALPDPAIAAFRRGVVAVSTGPNAPRAYLPRPGARWRVLKPALKRKPAWASANVVWAPDLVKIGRRWLLFYSAPVRGLGKDGRCIGVAQARSPLTRFRTIGRRPLVCPRKARKTGPAQDPVRTRGLPIRGVIDPSVFVDRKGRPHLAYKTQGQPSSIRVVELNPEGKRVRKHRRSREIARSRGTIENPVVLTRRRSIVLIASEGNWGNCSYRTTWRSASSLRTLSKQRPRTLLRSRHRRVCGPGGADVVATSRGRTVLVFHGWTCGQGRRVCPKKAFRGGRWKTARRQVYAAKLVWRDGRPFAEKSRRSSLSGALR